MKYFEELKNKVLEKCLFQHARSVNGSFVKCSRGMRVKNLSYNEFASSEGTTQQTVVEEMEQKRFVLFQNRDKPVNTEILRKLAFEDFQKSGLTDSQSIVRILSFYFIKMVKDKYKLSPKTISADTELENIVTELAVNENSHEEIAILIDEDNLNTLSRKQLKGDIQPHESRKIFNTNTYNYHHPVMTIPNLGIDEFIVFNKNCSFCYSDLNFLIEKNQVVMEVKIGLHNINNVKLLVFGS